MYFAAFLCIGVSFPAKIYLFKEKDFRITGLPYTSHCNEVFIDIEISLVTKTI